MIMSGTEQSDKSIMKQECIKEIRAALAAKEASSPIPLSESGFEADFGSRTDCYVHQGYASIWDGVRIPEGAETVVIKKRSCRDSANQYLAFGSVRQLQEFRRSANVLGMSAYLYFDEWLTPKLQRIASGYSLSSGAYESVQNAVECSVGLYFSQPDAENMSDAQLIGTLGAYIKKTVPQKAAKLFGKEAGRTVYIDEQDFEFVRDETADVFDNAFAADNGTVSMERLISAISENIYKFRESTHSDERWDMKDSLLTQIVASENAARAFVAAYYSVLRDRRTYRRPVAFAWQVTYAFERGREYLKNPLYIGSCYDTELLHMLNEDIRFISGANRQRDAEERMKSLRRDESIAGARLSDCALGAEQIGKALSKEMRTEEVCYSLAEALAIAVTEHKEGIGNEYIAECKGAANHE